MTSTDWESDSISIDLEHFRARVKLIIELGILSKALFAELVEKEAKKAIDRGEITKEEAEDIGVSRSSVSRVLSGQINPKRIFVLLCIRALFLWYGSDFFKTSSLEAGFTEENMRKFTREDARDLMHLAGFSTPREVEEAMRNTQRGEITKRRSFPTIEQFKASREKYTFRSDDDINTDGNIQAMPVDQYRITS